MHIYSKTEYYSKTLNIAEGGYQSQMNILQQIKENLTQAADGALSSEQRGAIGDRIESLLTEFNEINDQTKYNGFVLFNDSDADRRMTFQVGEESIDRFDVDFHNSKRAAAGEDLVDIDAILDNGDLIDSTTYNGTQMENATESVYTGSSTTITGVSVSDGLILDQKNIGEDDFKSILKSIIPLACRQRQIIKILPYFDKLNEESLINETDIWSKTILIPLLVIRGDYVKATEIMYQIVYQYDEGSISYETVEFAVENSIEELFRGNIDYNFVEEF